MPTSCTALEASLKHCEGKPVLPGLRRRLYYTHKQNISAWPTLVKDSLGRVTSAVYSGSFELIADATWKAIDILQNKSQLTSEAQGEAPSQTQLNKLVAVLPGTDEEASMLASYVNNSDIVMLVPTADGKYRVLGSEIDQTVATVAQDLGQGAAGTASTTLNAQAADYIPAPFYEGEIVTEDGVINPDGSGSGN